MKKPNTYLPPTKYLMLILLFLFAFGERVLFDFGPNVELITTAMVLSSFYFAGKNSFWLIFAIIALSDIVIGNSNIFLFTWSGFLIPAILAGGIIKKLTTHYSLRTAKNIFTCFTLLVTGLSSNIFFYLWTNFGVWYLGTMYPKTIAGLLSSYINALPFLRYQMISTLIFVPAGFLFTELTIYLIYKFQLKQKVSRELSFIYK